MNLYVYPEYDPLVAFSSGICIIGGFQMSDMKKDEATNVCDGLLSRSASLGPEAYTGHSDLQALFWILVTLIFAALWLFRRVVLRMCT